MRQRRWHSRFSGRSTGTPTRERFASDRILRHILWKLDGDASPHDGSPITAPIALTSGYRNRLAVGWNLLWNYLTFARHARLINGEIELPVLAEERLVA